MMDILKPYLLTFIPLFVAVDAIGNIPLFIGLVETLNNKQRQKAIMDSVATATIMAVLFMFLGKGVLRLLSITIADFQIAGGLILFILAARDLTQPEGAPGKLPDDFGVVPLGMPLIAGPALITTLLVLVQTQGMPVTVILAGAISRSLIRTATSSAATA